MPKPSEILFSPAVAAAATELMALTAQTGLEYGAFLYLNADGTILVGPTIVGTATTMPGLNSRLHPDNAIGSIHSHPVDLPPSPDDGAVATATRTFVTVATASHLYLAGPSWTPYLARRR